MSATVSPATVYLHRYLCDECGEEMYPTGVMLPMSPPLYRHRCLNGHQVSLGRVHPYQTFEPTHVSPAAQQPPQ